MATTTITTTAPEDARIVAAFGTFLRLGRNATQAEVKAALVVWLTGIVNDQEYQTAKNAIAVTNIAPT